MGEDNVDRFWIFLILACVALSLIIPQINNHTYGTSSITGFSDEYRYYVNIQNASIGERPAILLLYPLTVAGEEPFQVATTFLIYLLIGWMFYANTKDKLITLLALLCFSTTLLASTAIYAQAIVVIVGLYFWIYVPVEINRMCLLKWLLFGMISLLSHALGILLVAALMFGKLYESRFRVYPEVIKPLFILIYVSSMFLLLTTGRITAINFFYPTISPVNLGSFNNFLWAAFLSLPIAVLFYNTDSLGAVLVGCLIFVGATASLLLSGLEVDFWRCLIVFDWIALFEIAKSKRKPMTTAVITILILFGLARVVLGLRIF